VRNRPRPAPRTRRLLRAMREGEIMRISNKTLDAAFAKFGERRWEDDDIRELVKFIVNDSLDMDAAATAIYETWDSVGKGARELTRLEAANFVIAAALGEGDG